MPTTSLPKYLSVSSALYPGPLPTPWGLGLTAPARAASAPADRLAGSLEVQTTAEHTGPHHARTGGQRYVHSERKPVDSLLRPMYLSLFFLDFLRSSRRRSSSWTKSIRSRTLCLRGKRAAVIAGTAAATYGSGSRVATGASEHMWRVTGTVPIRLLRKPEIVTTLSYQCILPMR